MRDRYSVGLGAELSDDFRTIAMCAENTSGMLELKKATTAYLDAWEAGRPGDKEWSKWLAIYRNNTQLGRLGSDRYHKVFFHLAALEKMEREGQ